jgi:hypothetical protein
MGYVSINIGDLSGNTCTRPIKLAWTKIGREYLIGKRNNRKKGITIKYFSISDSDINYSETNKNLVGFVPNITGIENDCLVGTLKDSFKYNVNLNREGLILVRDLNITFNNNPSTLLGCTPESLIYDIYLNGVSILKQQFNYNYLFPNNTFYTNSELQTKQNDIIENYINDSVIGLYTITINTSETSIGSGLYIINSYTITTNNKTIDSSFSDNSNSICNNLIKSNISYIQKIITNPNLIVTENTGSFFIPPCGSQDCSLYYGSLASTQEVQITQIIDCIISNFDDWEG